ncbi:hypothetical protein FJY93_03090 [Candidatus Kaiserbacteria bacterium]|nr:hypothetical protein [Candidatus Kaiserbacteria bacterium]
MPEGLPTFVRATFYKDVPGETDEERQVVCQGSLGSCLPNVLGVFRFPDPEGVMEKHKEHFKDVADVWAVLNARIERSRLPRPFLRLRRWWVDQEVESILAKEILLVKRQMAVSDVVEEKSGTLHPLDNYELFTRLDELHDATHVQIVMCRGRVREPAFDFVA